MSFYRVLYEASLQTFVVVTRVALREKSAAGSFKFSTQMFELPLNLAWERDVGEDAKMLGIAPLRVFTTSPQLRHFMDCSIPWGQKNRIPKESMTVRSTKSPMLKAFNMW